LELIVEAATSQMPGFERLPLGMRLLVRAMEPFSGLRRLNRLLLYRV